MSELLKKLDEWEAGAEAIINTHKIALAVHSGMDFQRYDQERILTLTKALKIAYAGLLEEFKYQDEGRRITALIKEIEAVMGEE